MFNEHLNLSEENIKKASNIALVVVAIFLVGGSLYFVYSNYKKGTNTLSSNSIYKEALSLGKTDPKKAANLVNSINSEDLKLNKSDTKELLTSKIVLNNTAGNTREYLLSLKNGIDNSLFSAKARAYSYEMVAVVLEQNEGDDSVLALVKQIFPDSQGSSTLELQNYFLDIAESIDRTPYEDIFRARFVAYSMKDRSPNVEKMQEVKNLLTAADKRIALMPDSSDKTMAMNESSVSKTLVLLYLSSVVGNSSLEKSFGKPLDIIKIVFESAPESSSLQARAFSLYMVAYTLSGKKDLEFLTKSNILLKNKITDSRYLYFLRDTGLEAGRRLATSTISSVIVNFPDAKNVFL